MPPRKKSTKTQKTNELKENTVPKKDTKKKDLEENSEEITKTRKSSRTTETANDNSKDSKKPTRGKTTRSKNEIAEDNSTDKKKTTGKRKKENVDVEEPEEKVVRVSSRSKKSSEQIAEEPRTEKSTSKRSQTKKSTDNNTESIVEEPKKGRKRGTNKTEEKPTVQSKRTKKVEVDEDEPTTRRQQRATAKKKTQDDMQDEEIVSDDEPSKITKRTARKPKVDKEEKTEKVLKNKTSNDFEAINYDCSRLNEHGKEWNLKIASWNVDGIRAWLNKGCLEYLSHEKPDIFCIQETKCSYEKLPPEIREYKGYHQYWFSADKDGYAGVGVLTKKMPLHVINGIEDAEHDSEGRVITAEFEKFYLCCVYVPNSGRGLVTMPKRLDWNEKFKKFVNDLNAKKPVIICGDMNVAHKEIDLKNPKTNKKTAGFTQEERDGMTDFLSNGYVDVFRKLYPDKEGAYTFWTYMANSRAKNVGWRVDYFLVSERIAPNVCDNVIRSEIYGSDHCPLVLFLNI